MIAESDRPPSPALARREMIKLGAGVVAAALDASRASAQSAPAPAAGPAPPPRAPNAMSPPPQAAAIVTRAGYRNGANRIGGNGPMDDTSRRIVKYVTSFSERDVTEAIAHAAGNVMVDSIASLISGFESEPARISARLAKTVQSDLKCTVLGYGITTSPELAAFANGCMLRHSDFNDLGPGGHCSDIISGILAVGEALHSTGPEVLAAVVVGYELLGGLQEAAAGTENGFGWDGPYEGPAAAMAVGRLMKLNEDQLANALSLTLVAHLPMSVTHVGALSHWKGCHALEYVKCAVWSALLAREGMTGPSQPFEGRQGLWDHIGPYVRELRLPARADMVVQRIGFKRTPTEGSSQAILEIVPQLRAWTKVEDIEAVHIELAQGGWMEIGDGPKWDPRNRETADHSMPYMIARALMDGELYLDSFTPEKYMDPAARRLMDKVTMSANPRCAGLGPYRVTVRKKSGDVMTKEWLPASVEQGAFHTPMTDQDIVNKFKRVCAFMHVADDQRDRALAAWSNLRAVRDIADPMRDLARFGQPKPVTA